MCSWLVLWTGLGSHLELIQGKQVESYYSTLLTDHGQALSSMFPFGVFCFFFLPSYAKKFPSVLQDVPTTFPVLAITYKVRWIHSKMYMAWREFYVLLRGLLAFPTVKHFEICGWKNPALYRTMKVLTPSGINPTALGRPEIIIVFQLRKETASCVELWVLSVLFLPSEEELSCSVCMKKCNGTLQWVT